MQNKITIQSKYIYIRSHRLKTKLFEHSKRKERKTFENKKIIFILFEKCNYFSSLSYHKNFNNAHINLSPLTNRYRPNTIWYLVGIQNYMAHHKLLPLIIQSVLHEPLSRWDDLAHKLNIFIIGLFYPSMKHVTWWNRLIQEFVLIILLSHIYLKCLIYFIHSIQCTHSIHNISNYA